jgi:ATP-independent RNA helicase DbpA
MQQNDWLQTSLDHLGIKELNEMQQSAWKHYEKNDHLIVLSPTGSGKTLAFLLPVVHQLNPQITNKVQALIMAPSRELALQIESVFKSLKTGFKVNCCYGGHPMSIEKNNLLHPPAILIGTPGRLTDHIERKNLRLDGITTLVIDEFDKSLEFGFEEDMKYIISQLPNLKKKVMTSATHAIEIPAFVELENATTLDFLHKKETESKLIIKKVVAEKSVLDTLFQLLCTLGNGSTLIFCNFKEKVEEVSRYLNERGLSNAYFHGGLEQVDREKALIKFRNGSTEILVTSDLASRGLDIPEIKHIIHVQLPPHEDAFIHRNGRTARMNAEGMAFILTEKNESYPGYINRKMEAFVPNPKAGIPAPPAWTTLYFGKGKKNKLNKVDLVGFLSQKGGLEKHEIGLLEVKDFFSYAAITTSKVKEVLKRIKDEKIKNMATRIEVCK